MYIDPDDGKSVKQLAAGRTTEELKARSHAASVRSSEEDNAYRIDGIHSAIDEYDFMIQVLELGLEDIVYLYSASRWLVMGKYWYFNRTGKWSRKGKADYYKSKDFKDFVSRYLSNDWDYQRWIREKMV